MKKILLISLLLFAVLAVFAQTETSEELAPHPLDSTKLAVVTTLVDTANGTYTVQYSLPKDSAMIQLEMFQQIESRNIELAQYKALSYTSEQQIKRFTKIANKIDSSSYKDYVKEKLKVSLKGDYLLIRNGEKIAVEMNGNLKLLETAGNRKWAINPDSPYLLSLSEVGDSDKFELIKISQEPETWRTLEGEKVVLRRKG